MNRDTMIQNLQQNYDNWDVIIIGGGATGLGAAVDSASRGFKTLLLEGCDFAKGTSSKSTKLIHGGLRYLQQGNVALVIEALKERGLLCQNAPHLVHHLPFLVPNYKWWEGPFYGIGLKIYDLLSGKLGLEPSKHLTRKQTLKAIPTLEPAELRGGVIYYDGQFDDARLAITLARTAVDHGATLINYMKVTQLIKEKGICTGVKAKDIESSRSYTIKAKVVINATGVEVDSILKMDNSKATPLVAPSQGIHLVLPRKFQPGDTAILVPHTDDGRVIFIIPWKDRVLIGTTDTAVDKPVIEPKPRQEEIDFLLKHAGRYLVKDPKRADVLSVFAGLRPLIRASAQTGTSGLSREHTILVSKSGLITIAGGKWTTYRKMAEDVIDKAILVGDLPKRAAITENLKLHGAKKGGTLYGFDQPLLNALGRNKRLHPQLPYYEKEVVWAVQQEMARTLEDVLSRRTRALLLNAKASLEIAPHVAKIMAKELKKNVAWQKKQVTDFKKIAKNYLIENF